MTLKRLFLAIIALIPLVSECLAQKEEGYRMRTVVLDPGHGGHDPGNLGTGKFKNKEKDIALDVALKVGKFINEVYPDIKVIYTRDDDTFIGLNERADIANRADADLFISIHCNAAANTAAYGVETFTLGLHASEENLKVAMKENQAIFLEDNYEAKYEGFDPTSPESIIALTIMQSAFLEQSLKISSFIQKQFKEKVGRKDRGVKQAGFLVLRRTTMPSILIELGFLTNVEEEKFLNSDNGRVVMAAAIFKGFRDYKDRVEGSASAARPEPVATKPVPADTARSEATSTPAPAPPVAEKTTEQLRKEEEERKRKEAEEEKARKQQALEAAKAEKERLEKLKKEQDEKKRLKEEEDRARRLEAERLAAEKAQKERELEQAKRDAEEKEKKEMLDRLHREAVAEQAKREFQQRLSEREKARQDSIGQIHAERMERKKREIEEAEAATKALLSGEKPEKKEETAPPKEEPKPTAVIPQLADKPLTPEEAELLYLEKRRKELEEKIERIRVEEEEKRKQKTGEKPRPSPAHAPPVAEKPKPEPTPALKEVKAEAVDKAVILSVQIMTSAKPLELNSPRFNGERPDEYAQDGLYKYTVGRMRSMEAAVLEQRRLRKAGFEGAFVVAFLNGERITLDKARELLTQ